LDGQKPPFLVWLLSEKIQVLEAGLIILKDAKQAEEMHQRQNGKDMSSRTYSPDKEKSLPEDKKF
jgi:hypothetical protein